MFPIVHVHNFSIQTSILLMIVSVIACFCLFKSQLKEKVSNTHLISFFILFTFAALIGARAFYLIFEHKGAFEWSLFSNYRGMTFYGSFILIAVLLFVYTRFIKDKQLREKFWLSGILSCLITYSLLRLGCFATGCCWGAISALPWAVQYFHPLTVMPMKGIPVHPVQAYDAAYSFILFIFFWKTKDSPTISKYRLPLFFILFPTGRIITELFRGDAYRGVDLLNHFSTSQLISIGFIIMAFIYLSKNFVRKLLPFLMLTLLCSCLPKEPSRNVLRLVKDVDTSYVELYKMNNRKKKFHPKKVNHYKTVKTNRTAIFVALDETVQFQFQPLIQEAYKSEDEIRIEDISWWRFAPDFRFMYDHVIKIPYDQFHAESLTEAILLAEGLGKTYDLYILTHGIPNHFTSSKGFPLISYEDINKLGPLVSKLDMVFLQSCFGNTLTRDFFELGANSILAFEGWNRNFFYVDFFVKEFKRRDYNSEEAFLELEDELSEKMEKSRLYKKILPVIGLSHEEYMESFPSPGLYLR